MTDEEREERYVVNYIRENSLCFKYSEQRNSNNWEFDVVRVRELIDSIIETKNRNNATRRKIKNRINKLTELKELLNDTVFEDERQINGLHHAIYRCEQDILITEAIETFNALSPEEQRQLPESFD